MVGRFPLLTDENVPGPLIDALRARGWDVVRVIEVFGERSIDDAVFSYAAETGRVLVSSDEDCLKIAGRWLDAGRGFRLLYWHQGRLQRGLVTPFIQAFEALAADDSAFVAGIEYLAVGRA